MKRIQQSVIYGIPASVAAVFILGIVGFYLWHSITLTGHFSYTIDDAYIHLAVAEGIWGWDMGD